MNARRFLVIVIGCAVGFGVAFSGGWMVGRASRAVERAIVDAELADVRGKLAANEAASQRLANGIGQAYERSRSVEDGFDRLGIQLDGIETSLREFGIDLGR